MGNFDEPTQPADELQEWRRSFRTMNESPPLPPEQSYNYGLWPEIKSLFGQALSLGPAKRDAFLAEIHAKSPELGNGVQRLWQSMNRRKLFSVRIHLKNPWSDGFRTEQSWLDVSRSSG